ncbi:polysaccharide deacetylase family protein [Candidatus Latescibacterota bacterium]
MVISSVMKARLRRAGIEEEMHLEPAEGIAELASSIGDSCPSRSSASVVTMTHDVDYVAGYECVREMAELEAERGIRATYNFLVGAGYEVDQSCLLTLRGLGHEIGLHGHGYDLRLAYRRQSTILQRLRDAKNVLQDLLGEPVVGFRNHSMLLSARLLSAIESLGFLYDSGLSARHVRNSFNLYFCWPFRYEGRALFEVPVMWPQDTEVFRVVGMSDTEALEYYQRRIAMALDFGGVACLNHHPSIMRRHREYFSALLEFIEGLPHGTSTCRETVLRWGL